MLSRHRKEMSELRSKEMEMKKAAARGSKAEQKVKKKQVEEEISRLSSKLKAIHSKELASLGYKSNGTETNDIDKLVKAITGVSANISHSDSPKPTRSLRRKEKRIQQEAAREQRIQEEQSNIISERMIENEKLEKKLQPLGLTINEIKADGHCLYRAVEDQLSFQGNSFRHTYQELRAMVAAYMREHTTEFLPFFLSENKLETGSEDSHSEKFERYCFEVESTAAWGGQLELNALMHCLRKHIIIFSGSFPDVEMGKEYKTEGANSNPSIRLSYHKHAFGLGEHYNSVVPIPI